MSEKKRFRRRPFAPMAVVKMIEKGGWFVTGGRNIAVPKGRKYLREEDALPIKKATIEADIFRIVVGNADSQRVFDLKMGEFIINIGIPHMIEIRHYYQSKQARKQRDGGGYDDLTVEGVQLYLTNFAMRAAAIKKN